MGLKIVRRDFLKLGASFCALFGLTSEFLTKTIFSFPKRKPDLVIVSGLSPDQLVKKALEALGGMKRFVKKGNRVVLKPNIAFSRTPEQAATTNPLIVEALIRSCYQAGAGKVIVPEHPCHNWQITSEKSRIKEAVQRTGGTIYGATKRNLYRQIDIPKGKSLKSTEVIKDVLKADVLINVPIAKVHDAAKLTLGMKNLMGVVWNRRFFHRTNLHQCIADLSTAVKPHLVVLDATRILTTNGPQGPGEVKEIKKVIVGTDPVAVDSYGATLFGMKGEDIPHIKIAHQMGLGKINLKTLTCLEL